MSSGGRVLRVLPDGERVEEALVAASARTGFADASAFLSFSQFISRFEGARLLDRRPATPLTSRVVMWSAARKLGPGPFGAYVHEPAFARAALELVFDLKAGGVEPYAFLAAVEQVAPSRLERGRYLGRLYSAYDELMGVLRLADREDEQLGALEALRTRGLPPPLRRFSAIEVSQLYDFSPLRTDFVLALAQACDRAGVQLRLSVPAAGSPHVDAAVDPVLGLLERRGQELTHLEALKADLLDEGRPLAPLGRHLFAPEAKALAGQAVAPALALCSAATAREEARLLARRARALVDAGVPPEEIAIAYRDLGEEAEWLAEALEALQLPSRMRRGAPLTSTAAGRMALELPLVVDDGYPAEGVARLLSSRYAPHVSAGAPDAPGAWLKLASVRDDRLGAREGRGAYDLRLTALAARLQRRSASGGAAAVRAVHQRALRLISICERLPAEARAFELLDRWWSCVTELGLPSAVRQNEQLPLPLAHEESPRDLEATPFGRAILRALARDQAASEALMMMVSELDAALKLSGAGAQRMARRTFHRWLLDAAADFNLAPKGTRGGAVRILDLRELVGRSFAHVLVGGLVEGRFPGRARSQPLFPDEDRVAVNRHLKKDAFRLASGEPDGRAPWRLAEDRLLLYLALGAGREGVTLCHARSGPRGQEQVASPFLDELRRLTGVPLEAVPLRPVPPLDEVETEAQLRERAALEVLARPELRISEPDAARAALREQLSAEGWFGAARALAQVEEERLRFFSDPQLPPGPFSGAATAPELAPELARLFAFGPERPLSASTLGRFGNCAFQGFLAFALRLEEPEEPGEEIDARGNGSFWHKVMEELFPRLAEAGLLRRPLEEVPQPLIDEALEQAAAAAEKSAHVGHPALWRLSRERARAMARKILATDHRGLPFHAHEPEHRELRFGRPSSPEPWREVALPPAREGETPIHLEGTIDRLDSSGPSVGVVDYKSGALGSGPKLMEGLLATEFQLPLYLYAAKVAGRTAGRAAWLSLRDGEPRHLDSLLHEHHGQTLAELLDTTPAMRERLAQAGGKNLANAVHGLAGALRQGQFPARPQDCRYCAFGAVCRISERRLVDAEGT